ncbi:hypothetical protein Forpi1262_v015143 [Fusarium oxysporum f. sp. raphani]|uniref:Uncharacterized protein n=1 Tax=Fusarium oxysporum f. sp. raphani TaxID=96318 RepID=A0A8J5PKW7_FUSOX|nr:hypothetical protein Forpi1262_v015143 [Fusarium oxysporum f. sp. raphani]
MAIIEKIMLVEGQRFGLSVSNNAAFPDLDSSGQQTQDYCTDVLYDVQSGQTTQRPAVIKKGATGVLFTVQVSGLSSSELGSPLRLVLGAPGCYGLVSQVIQPGTVQSVAGQVVVFNMSQNLDPSVDPLTPWCIKRKASFLLQNIENPAMAETWGDDVMEVEMELYLLGYELPPYFDDKVPLLLLRMFVAAATQQQIRTAQQWVAMVAKICHGSAHPETGEPAETENHWLKYNTLGGGSFFMAPNNVANPAHLKTLQHYFNYGGSFFLSAWLDTYRNFRDQGSFSVVNCYDQAGAVEVAASLGVSYNCLAWEYHQPYGFITKDTELVGWGACNNPMFEKIPKNKLLENNMDTHRTIFGNHAFISWSPDFDPAPSVFDESHDPSSFPGMLAIDACAGPHLGNEDRGVWVSPLSYPDPSVYPKGYTDKSTYWRTRDDQYLLQEHTFQTHRGNPPTWKDLESLHFWTPGITGLSTEKQDSSFIFIHPDNPFEGSNITFPLSTDFPNSSLAFVGSVSDLQRSFWKSLNNNVSGSSNWGIVRIDNITLSDGGMIYEKKWCDTAESVFNFVSFKMWVVASLTDALAAQKARAAQVIVTSTLEASDFQANLATPSDSQKIHTLQADFTALVVWQNLFFEITGYVGIEEIKALAHDLVTEILNGLETDVGSKWQLPIWNYEPFMI